MTKLFILGDIHSIDTNFSIDFLRQLEVKSHFKRCQEIIEVKVKSVTKQEDGTFIIEFASEEDAKLYLDNYRVNPIRMIFV